MKRVNRINQLKNAIAREPELRHLSALFFFCTQRLQFIEALRSRFPGEEPLAKTGALLSRLATVAGRDLGFEMTPEAATALGALFQGKSESALLATARPGSRPAELSSAYHALRGSDLFSALFFDIR